VSPASLHEARPGWGDPGSTPVCSLVVLTYNHRELLERCLASLRRHWPRRGDGTLEVVVVDDASSDGTPEWLARAHPGIRVVRRQRNAGFCVAANDGLAVARGRFIHLMNNDTEVTPGWVEAGLAPFADPTVGAVSPLVLVRSDPSRVDSAGDAYSWIGWPTKRGHGEPAARWAVRPVEEVFGASGSSAFYRAEALRRAGGFDPLLGSYYEDIDLSFRLRWAGYRCVFTPHCRIHHEISATNDHRSPALQRRMARNAELVFWSNLPPGMLPLAIGPHLAFLAAQAAWRLARGRLRPFVAGKLDALRAWPEIRARRRLRAELAQAAVAPPHFALTSGSLQDVRNHLRRPPEQSRTRPPLG
jgi:GT2 family glycosyltransferase